MQAWFQALVERLSITEGREQFLKQQTTHLVKRLREASQVNFDNPSNIIEKTSNKLKVNDIWYGGSFDLGVYIASGFDLDVYVPYVPKSPKKKVDPKTLIGSVFFHILEEDLRFIQEKDDRFVINLKDRYSHAISMDFKHEDRNDIIYYDLNPAMHVKGNLLCVPLGNDAIKRVSPKREEEALSKINRKTKGRATNLIRLVKFCNYENKWNMKSYLILRLVEDIFSNANLNQWTSALQLFFKRAPRILNSYLHNQKLVLPDRVETNRSILTEIPSPQVQENVYDLQEAYEYCKQGIWNKIFPEL